MLKLKLHRWMLIGTLAACAASSAAAQAPATVPSARTVEAIMADVQAAGVELRDVMDNPESLADRGKREAAAATATPLLQKMLGYADELEKLDDPQAKIMAEGMRTRANAMLALLGDAVGREWFAKQAAGAGSDAIRAKGMLLLADWLHNSQDAAAQNRVLDDLVALAKANPQSKEIPELAGELAQLPAASPELAQRAQKVKGEHTSARPPGSLVDKPLVISGVLRDGQQFSTGQWKGKVILVDFWATWCGPCIAELPRLKKAYADFHGRGLEVLGVSSDENLESLNAFLTENKEMPWPQLFDAKNPGWHSLANEFGVDSIPRMFLIDKKGIVRSVDARANFEELLPKLLDE
jgi:thiol-disulfide isomerase/thioredoxin